MRGAFKKPKTTTVSSVVPEEVENWIRARAQREDVAPSHWISSVLAYSMMIDALTQGQFTNVIHDFLNMLQLAKENKQFDPNPWRRFTEAFKDYNISRVRKGLELYRRGNNVPDTINMGIVTILANTSSGQDYVRPFFDQLSDTQVLEALRVMEKNGEVALEGDNVRVIRLSETPRADLRVPSP